MVFKGVCVIDICIYTIFEKKDIYKTQACFNTLKDQLK